MGASHLYRLSTARMPKIAVPLHSLHLLLVGLMAVCVGLAWVLADGWHASRKPESSEVAV
jgi:hypothetical protein